MYLHNILIVMVISKCLVDFWFSCFKLLICTYKGTSSFMTSALDALVLVQVCVCVRVCENTRNTVFRTIVFDVTTS